MSDETVSVLSAYLADHFTEVQEETPELLPGLDLESVWQRRDSVSVFVVDRESGRRFTCRLLIRVAEDSQS